MIFLVVYLFLHCYLAEFFFLNVQQKVKHKGEKSMDTAYILTTEPTATLFILAVFRCSNVIRSYMNVLGTKPSLNLTSLGWTLCPRVKFW